MLDSCGTFINYEVKGKCTVQQNLNFLPFINFFCWCDKVYHKHEVRFLLYID